MMVFSKQSLAYAKLLESKLKTFQTEHTALPPISTLERWTKRIKVTDLDQGNDYVDRIRTLLGMFYRSDLQVYFHELMLGCANRIIYGDAVDQHGFEILQQQEFESMDLARIITAPRRFGKSVSTIIFVICMFMTIPRIEISIFSTGKRASGDKVGLMAGIREMLFGRFSISPKQLESKTPENLHIRFGESDLRKINAYPGSVDTYVLFCFFAGKFIFVSREKKEGERIGTFVCLLFLLLLLLLPCKKPNYMNKFTAIGLPGVQAFITRPYTWEFSTMSASFAAASSMFKAAFSLSNGVGLLYACLSY